MFFGDVNETRVQFPEFKLVVFNHAGIVIQTNAIEQKAHR